MEKDIYLTYLYDYYKELLTSKQRDYFENYSLSKEKEYPRNAIGI